MVMEKFLGGSFNIFCMSTWKIGKDFPILTINFHELRVWQNTKISALVCVHRLDFWNVNVWVTSNQISCVFFGSPNLRMLGSVEATDCK